MITKLCNQVHVDINLLCGAGKYDNRKELVPVKTAVGAVDMIIGKSCSPLKTVVGIVDLITRTNC